MGTAAIGAANVSGTLGTVTVTDQRASLSLASWTTRVTSSAFTTGGASQNETIPATDVGYNPGLATTAQTGIGVFAPGLPGCAVHPGGQHLVQWAGLLVGHRGR